MASLKSIISRAFGSGSAAAGPSAAPAPYKHTGRDLLDFVLAREVPGAVSHAQLRQDVLALMVTDFKRDGYFVEFGATDGKEFSNSYMLEKDFGWNGIVAEPSVDWHEALLATRNCTIDLRCVWRASGETINFDIAKAGVLSTISDFSDADLHARGRRAHRQVQVETVSLLDLLDQHNAPEVIDYLSVDTEGSEFEILNAFDFGKYRFRFISVEHNFTEKRTEIYDLLTANGYRRILEHASSFDDWYVSDPA